MIRPERSAFAQQAACSRVVPVWTEIVADGDTPVSAFAKLGGNAPSFLLESAEQNDLVGRFSFIGFDAQATFTAHGKTVTLTEETLTKTYETERDPLDELERWMDKYRAPRNPDLPPFCGGAVGYLGYDCVRWFEPTIPEPPKDELGIPDMFFQITGSVVIFDHKRRRIQIVANAFLDDRGVDAAYDAACKRIGQIIQALRCPIAFDPIFTGTTPPAVESTSNTTREEYHGMVRDAQEYIRAGDIFQIVPSQRFETDFSGDALDLYRSLRFVNPSPYMFCLRCPGGYALVGSSPEVHVRLTGPLVEIRPIAGTRRRGETPEDDAANAEDLLADPKERAEHLMLVDLARNDVGRIAEFGSVKVTDFMTIERYSHVMHIVSHVSGQLAGGRSAYDVMRATFPAGTVSGSPKVRAMQIINELEKSKRCSYAGAVGYFGFDGNLDSCIALRTVLLKDGRAYVQSGGGVVADSTPDGEYQETVNKAMAGMRAIDRARRDP
ncbi:MAG: anthranilate synthase component I [Verrucomicrobiaceae bacterium]|nr:MAG: anthranilate synthase component I [Verrucomicrobiaceae bacterium]